MYASTLWDPSSASNTVTPVVGTSGYELIPAIAAGARQPLISTPRDALELHLRLTPQVLPRPSHLGREGQGRYPVVQQRPSLQWQAGQEAAPAVPTATAAAWFIVSRQWIIVDFTPNDDYVKNVVPVLAVSAVDH
jgi:hypothetical protein